MGENILKLQRTMYTMTILPIGRTAGVLTVRRNFRTTHQRPTTNKKNRTIKNGKRIRKSDNN